MLNLFKKNQKKVDTTERVFKIKGMHCTSCAMNIDGELEDLEGVKEATTNYAKQVSVVTFEPEKVTQEQIIAVITKLGYQATTQELEKTGVI